MISVKKHILIVKSVLVFVLLSTTFVGKGQNLVPNGDFEGYSGCPNNLNQINLALNWMNPTTNSLTADYFNQCSLFTYVGVPSNYFGYQPAHGGMGYSGIHRWASGVPNYREYIESSLFVPLTAGVCYYFEMYINLSNISRFTAPDIGVFFSDTLITGITNYIVLPYSPQINNNVGNIPDTLNWTLVSGNYLAMGGESFFLIGNFHDDASTNLSVYNVQSNYNASYIYIDDVSLTPCTGINENSNNASIHISQNPVSDNLQISGTIQSSEAEINLTDITGRICFHQNIFSKGNFNVNINVKDFSEGIYILNVRDGGKVFLKKVLIRHP